MKTVMKIDRSGIGFLANQEKKVEAQYQQYKSKPKHARPFAFNAHYMLRKDSSGKMKIMFLGPPNKNRPKKIWVAK